MIAETKILRIVLLDLSPKTSIVCAQYFQNITHFLQHNVASCYHVYSTQNTKTNSKLIHKN